MSFALGTLARDCGGALRGDPETQVSSVSTDTRHIERDALFVAIRGTSFDGHQFVPDAVAKGARAVLVSSDEVDTRDAAVIRVEDTVAALGAIAQAHRARFEGPVIAVSGSNGKTTFIETVINLFQDYAIKTPADTLLARRDTGIPNDVAALRGARFVAAVEMEEGRRLAEVRVKELTGFLQTKES